MGGLKGVVGEGSADTDQLEMVSATLSGSAEPDGRGSDAMMNKGGTRIAKYGRWGTIRVSRHRDLQSRGKSFADTPQLGSDGEPDESDMGSNRGRQQFER